MRELVTGLAGMLARGRDAVLAVILEQAGSTPRGSGSMMVVRADGTIAGSVGGGPLEGRVMRRAADLFEQRTSRLLRFDLGASQAAAQGMVCGGEAVVLLDHLAASPENAAVFGSLAEALDAGRPTALALAMACHEDDRLTVTSRRALGGAPDQPPADALPDADLEAAMVEARRSGRPAVRRTPGAMVAVVPLAALKTAVLYGAGHVSLYTARLAAQVGFRTVVVDDRAEFANRRRFPLADDIRVVESFHGCLDGLPQGPETFHLVLTRGHVHDKTVLAQVLGARAAYLGMIGSRRKRDATYRALEDEGHAPEALARVHCPIGLSIKAETPEEIAVSIVAEMIQVRAEAGETTS